MDVVRCLQPPSYFQHDFLYIPPAVKGVGEYSREDLEKGQLNGVDDGKNTTKLCEVCAWMNLILSHIYIYVRDYMTRVY